MLVPHFEARHRVLLLAALMLACTSGDDTDVATHSSATDTPAPEAADAASISETLSDETDEQLPTDSSEAGTSGGEGSEPSIPTAAVTQPSLDGGPAGGDPPLGDPPLGDPPDSSVPAGSELEGGTNETVDVAEAGLSQCGIGTPIWEMSEALGICTEDCTICVDTVQAELAVGYFVHADDGCACQQPKQRFEGSDAGPPPELSADTCEHVRGFVSAEHAEVACTGIDDCKVCEHSHWGADVTDYSIIHSDCDCEHEEFETRCGSRLGLDPNSDSADWEVAACEDEARCNVCPWEVDEQGNTESLMLHQCGCPAPIVVSN